MSETAHKIINDQTQKEQDTETFKTLQKLVDLAISNCDIAHDMSEIALTLLVI